MTTPPPRVLPVCVVIPTRNRAAVLRRMLESLARQSAHPKQIVLVDASDDRSTHASCIERPVAGLESEVQWLRAGVTGAAPQRNEGIRQCRCDVIGFFDDDILFEPDCVARLFDALQSDPRLGGVNAMITNQRYQAPGRVTRLVFRIMAGRRLGSYAGRLLGPALNILPEDRDDLPEMVPVEWLNTTCTLYRRAALPDPAFAAFFTGYSMMEDVTLSVHVGRAWRLANMRTARIFHDSQQGDHKGDRVAFSRMELTNRHFVMTCVLGRRGAGDYAKLVLWEMFQLVACALRARGGKEFRQMLKGRYLALRGVLCQGRKAAG